MEQTLMDKLTILADSAKYDVACTSSGASRTARAGTVGSCYAPGCCHAFTADGRCVSLLKVLMTNCCSFDCGYCVNRRSNDIPRATFAPRELAELTMEFYRRNYIEGLFLSSAVLGTPDYTTERMLAVLRLLRGEYRFGGYIHAKAIPGTSPELLQQLGYLADRLSVNVELPSERSLNLLAPDKGRHSIFRPMKQIAVSGAQSKQEMTVYRHAPKFAPAGQSTQMIVGASPETDYHILKLTEGMYRKYSLKRVFYSAYIPVTFEFENRGGFIPGSFAEVWLLSDSREDALSLPVGALSEDQGVFAVFVRLEEEIFKRQEVTIGHSNGQRVEILAGLRGGEEVVVRGTHQVKLASASTAIPGHTPEPSEATLPQETRRPLRALTL